MEGWVNAVSYASVGWLILMGALYILGALLYAGRIPERYFPGKCDIWVWTFYPVIFFIYFLLFYIFYSIIELPFSVSPPTTVPKSSNIPCSGDCRRVCSLPRNIRNGRLSTDKQSMPRIGSSPVLNHTPASTTNNTLYNPSEEKQHIIPIRFQSKNYFCFV